MNQWEEKKWPFFEKFFKKCFDFNVSFRKRRKQKLLKKKNSFPSFKSVVERLAGKMIGGRIIVVMLMVMP